MYVEESRNELSAPPVLMGSGEDIEDTSQWDRQREDPCCVDAPSPHA